MSCRLLSLKSLLWAITSTPSQAERQSGTFRSNINLLPISFSPPNCFHLRVPLFVGLVVLQPWLPQKEPALLTGTPAGSSAAGWPAGWPASSGSTSFATLCHAAGIPACPSEVPRSSVDVREPTVSRNPASPRVYNKPLALPLKPRFPLTAQSSNHSPRANSIAACCFSLQATQLCWFLPD